MGLGVREREETIRRKDEAASERTSETTSTDKVFFFSPISCFFPLESRKIIFIGKKAIDKTKTYIEKVQKGENSVPHAAEEKERFYHFLRNSLISQIKSKAVELAVGRLWVSGYIEFYSPTHSCLFFVSSLTVTHSDLHIAHTLSITPVCALLNVWMCVHN